MTDVVQFKTIYLDMSTLGAYASELGDAGCLLDGWLIGSQRILCCGKLGSLPCSQEDVAGPILSQFSFRARQCAQL
jgi:hypothetical protein